MINFLQHAWGVHPVFTVMGCAIALVALYQVGELLVGLIIALLAIVLAFLCPVALIVVIIGVPVFLIWWLGWALLWAAVAVTGCYGIYRAIKELQKRHKKKNEKAENNF